MKAEVRHASSAPEFPTDERCHISEIGNDDGDELVSIARARVEAGVTTAWHRLHGISERYLIISGSGLVEVDGIEPTEVGPGDVVRIPAEAAQRITNNGNIDLVFYAICAPPFRDEAYVNLENSTRN